MEEFQQARCRAERHPGSLIWTVKVGWGERTEDGPREMTNTDLESIVACSLIRPFVPSNPSTGVSGGVWECGTSEAIGWFH